MPEISVDELELETLMAELEAETAEAIPTTAAAPAPAAEEPAAVQAEAAPAPAAPEFPKGKDPLESEESNFVLPPKMRAAAADPLPWEDDPSAGADPTPVPVSVEKHHAATALLGTQPKTVNDIKGSAEVSKNPTLKVVPPAAAPTTGDTHNVPPAVIKKSGALSHVIDVAAFKSETSINPTNLDNAFMEQSSLRAHYAELAARAEAQADRVKVQVEIKEAELYDKHRKLLAASGEKVTEKAVENAVKLDPVWGAIKNRLIEAETIAAINKGLIASLSDRKDMLVQLGADRREEGKGALRVLEDRSMRERAIAAAKT